MPSVTGSMASGTKKPALKLLEIIDKRAVVGNLSVSPSSIQFNNIEVGKTFETTIVLQNLSVSPKTIRVSLASSSGAFTLLGGPEVHAPYGLEKKVILQFQPTQQIEYNDKIIVKSDTDTIEIPVKG